jgi:hypothetical protein
MRGKSARGSAASYVPLACILTAAVLSSCVTVPPKTTGQWLGVLPPDSTIYISIHVKPSAAVFKRAIEEAGPAYNDLATLFDMTERMYLAVTLVPGDFPQFFILALGNYPTLILNWRLQGNADWKEMKSGQGSFFQGVKNDLQLAVPDGSTLLVSNGHINRILPRLSGSEELPLPPDVAEEMTDSDLVVFLPQLPGEILQRAQGNINVPIQQVWLDARKSQEGYEVGGTANVTTEREAKLVAVVMRLVLVAWLRSQQIPDVAERIGHISLAPEGNQVILTGLRFRDDEIVPVLISLIAGAAPAAPIPAMAPAEQAVQ